MTLQIAVFLALLQLGAPPVPEALPGNVEGTVVRAGTRDAIEDVYVDLVSTVSNDVDPTRPRASWSAVSDAAGRFAMKNVPPGTYRLTLSANGYVRQEYGQRRFPGRGTQITVAEGQTLKDVVAELTPTGAVSGTIRDTDKRPLQGVSVQLMHASYDQQGVYRLRPTGSVVRTDDRGEFRIFFLTPGRYYLNAGTPSGPPGTGDQRPLANEVQETYAYVYFPGTTDLKLASPIDIQPGVTRSGMDFMVNRVKGVRVAGRVIDGSTGKPPETPKVKLAYRDPGTPWDYDLEYMGRGKVTYNKDGTFEFRDVLPGLYALVVTVDIPGQPAPPQGVTPLQRIGYVPVEVGSSDMEGIVVTATPGTSIAGRLRVEGREDWKSAFQTTTAKLGVELQPSSNGTQPSTPGVPAPPYSALNPDGTFRIDNVMPGEFRFSVSWLRPGFYLKEARFGPTDILTQPFRYSGNEPGNLEIVLGSDAASLEGIVTDRFAGAARAQVVLVPDRARHRAELFKTVTANQSGGFSFTNVPPGDYKLYAWDTVEQYRWFDAEFLKSLDQFARAVRLTGGSRQSVDLRVIP